jgi:hypothetical protein
MGESEALPPITYIIPLRLPLANFGVLGKDTLPCLLQSEAMGLSIEGWDITLPDLFAVGMVDESTLHIETYYPYRHTSSDYDSY